VPGFPIRKSSNHSPVAGSSRLIAGSNVLHRLLVPRHPPYALRNLATIACARTLKRVRQKIRCSRSLCSSQDTDGKTWLPRRIRVQGTQARVSQRHAAASSGPNSVPGTLPVACPRSVAPVKENVLTEQSQESEPNNQCSTRKHGRPVTHSVTRGAGAP
jgi:hypothetical protein